MKMKMMLRIAACFLGLGCFAAGVRAGVVIQQEGSEPGSTKPKQAVTIYIDVGKLRVEGANPDGRKFLMIFDQDKQVVWNVMPDEGTYTEMTAAQVEGLANQMSQMMQQMQAQMAQMPPEQRKMMEDMMKQRMGGGGAPPPITVQEKGSGEKVGNYTTTHYEILNNGQRTSEIWAAPYSQLRLQEADFKTFQAMSKFFEPLARNAPAGSWSAGPMQQIQGFPVRILSYEGQRATYEWIVAGVAQRPLDAGLFTLPAGLNKQEMRGSGGMRGRQR